MTKSTHTAFRKVGKAMNPVLKRKLLAPKSRFSVLPACFGIRAAYSGEFTHVSFLEAATFDAWSARMNTSQEDSIVDKSQVSRSVSLKRRTMPGEIQFQALPGLHEAGQHVGHLLDCDLDLLPFAWMVDTHSMTHQSEFCNCTKEAANHSPESQDERVGFELAGKNPHEVHVEIDPTPGHTQIIPLKDRLGSSSPFLLVGGPVDDATDLLIALKGDTCLQSIIDRMPSYHNLSRVQGTSFFYHHSQEFPEVIGTSPVRDGFANAMACRKKQHYLEGYRQFRTLGYWYSWEKMHWPRLQRRQLVQAQSHRGNSRTRCIQFSLRPHDLETFQFIRPKQVYLSLGCFQIHKEVLIVKRLESTQ